MPVTEPDNRKETVVLVHGLWSSPKVMHVLARRLHQHGYQTLEFTYPTIRNTPFENAMFLSEFLERRDGPVVHFIGHSLGGIIIHHLQHHFPVPHSGRVVTLGTPFDGSGAARALCRVLPGRIILGKSTRHGLLSSMPAWRSKHELGSIAGNRRLGLGMLLPGIEQPSDGTVAVTETRLQGMQDHVVVNASHSSLLFSDTAITQAVHFLKHGSFSH